MCTSRHRCHGARSARRALGETAGWQRWYAKPTEVYLFRIIARNAAVDTPEDALRFLRSAASHNGLSLDTRGITVHPIPAGGTRLDVVFTADVVIPYVLPTTAAELTQKMMNDPQLRERYPQLSLEQGQFLQLTGPPDAIDFWLAHAQLWDDEVGPTDAYANAQGVYQGEADDGPRAKAWTVEPPDLGDKPKPPPPPISPAKVPWIVWALGGAALVGLGAHFVSKGTS